MTKISNLNYLIAVPLIVMSYHIYNFYETEPWVIRLGLAASFDVMVVLCFYLLKDEFISKAKRARQITWATLLVLIGFQLYVNVWAYSDLHWFRALMSGSIFPLVVGLISYIGMVREKVAEEKQQEERKQKAVVAKIEEADSVADLALIAEQRPFRDKRVEKAEVIRAYSKNDNISQVREIFLGSTNMKSVDRWLGKLDTGQAP